MIIPILSRSSEAFQSFYYTMVSYKERVILKQNVYNAFYLSDS